MSTRPCPTPYCPELQPCSQHTHGPFATAQRSTTLYHTTRWQQERKAQLQREPYCRACGGKANTADHVTPHRGNAVLFWNRSNLQSLCRRCSNAKTGREVAARHGMGVEIFG